MSETNRRAHWEQTYASKGEAGVSWFEDLPQISLDIIAEAGATKDSALIDIGGGAARLVDALLERGFTSLAVLDLSAAALDLAKARLGKAGKSVDWIVADVTDWQPAHAYDVWHDRAALHFLTDPADQAAYFERLRLALRPGGAAIIATFAPDGPERCSGLPVVRYDPATLAAAAGPSFVLAGERRHAHLTPWGATQAFQFSLLRRV
ncbi:class I SAM-dependent methyltransferase [Mesorhizobium sp. LHD-90]|uniref:class I SAM-dependent methyltransferase n=1 Tax=Mesorhizobium sp. LHD-90 TaxID=3071414 RepID=UPI0027DFECBB|nr:class I SAM-dependent methyltransferase [Mesorhizobium sp. LHD-90]MDQ6434901.1 class I SAM-dependent methyltransferase [Mesorhizobium sp. LHD-90]